MHARTASPHYTHISTGMAVDRIAKVASAVPHHRDEDPIPAIAHRQDEGTELGVLRGAAVELLNARYARVRGRIGKYAAALEDVVGDDQRARAREGDGPVEVRRVVVLVRVDEDQVER